MHGPCALKILGTLPRAVRFDATLSGIDATSVGSAGSSAAGLEDYIAFHSRIAPTAFEIGNYGIDDGTDNHSVGKPSDGVHLSIEDNWQNAPFSTRQGRDSFAPAVRWVAGGQRWSLGNLAAGQSANFDILLSLLTGTKVTTTGGNHTGGSCHGGSSHAGGVDFEFDDATSAGTFFGDFSEADASEMTDSSRCRHSRLRAARSRSFGISNTAARTTETSTSHLPTIRHCSPRASMRASSSSITTTERRGKNSRAPWTR